jgi:MraZ protein
MKGYDGALSIFKAAAFEKMVEDAQSVPFTKRNSRKYLRIQLGSACEMEVDKQGRIQLSKDLLAKCFITKDVVITGSDDCVEVWDRERYLAQEEENESSYEENAARIASLGE